MCSPPRDKLIHQSASVWQAGFQVKSSAKSERAGETEKQWRKTRRQRWEQWGDNCREGWRGGTQLSQDTGLAKPRQCVMVCNQSQSSAREKSTQWTTPASHSITPVPGQTCTLGQMLFVLSSSACQPLSLNDVGWDEHEKWRAGGW